MHDVKAMKDAEDNAKAALALKQSLGLAGDVKKEENPLAVVEKDGQRIAVRSNARMAENSVTDARTYQDFFVALDKAMFLTLHKVD